MKFALIGCGRISPNHIAAALKNNLDIVALCDIREDRMQNLLHTFDLCKSNVNCYQSYEDMLKSEDLDLIAIATESGSHAEIALHCIQNGVHCIIEKPIALSMKDAQAICNAAKEHDIVVCTSHQNRFNKSIQKIREALEQGRFGKLFHGTAHVRWNRGENYYKQAPWRGTWAQDGGCLMNQCIHNIDLLRWMMGDEITEVFAYSDNLSHSYIEAEDLGVAVVKFANGSYGVIEGTTNVYPRNLEETLYLFGEKGTVKAGGKSVNIIEEWQFADETQDVEKIKQENSEQPDNVYGFGHNPLYADVISAIENHKKPLVSAEEGKRALELVLAIYKSAAEGRPVKLPLVNCDATDFEGRFKKEKE